MTASFVGLLRQAIADRPDDHPVWEHDPKLAGRALAERLGVRVPALLAGPADHPRQIVPPRRVPFVLKPNRGCMGRGMMALAPLPSGRLMPVASGPGVVSWEQVCRRADRAVAKTSRRIPADRVGPPWFCEQLVALDPGGLRTAYGWQCFALGGHVLLIRQMRAIWGGPKLAFTARCWTPRWEPTVAFVGGWPVDDTMPPPWHGVGLVTAAERVAREVPGPFVRVDMMEDAAGPLFGELTPHPARGKFELTAEWDQQLGQAWAAFS